MNEAISVDRRGARRRARQKDFFLIFGNISNIWYIRRYLPIFACAKFEAKYGDVHVYFFARPWNIENIDRRLLTKKQQK